jgi:hypothetical protein
MKLFHFSTKLMEKKITNGNKLKTQLENRLKVKSFGSKVKVSLHLFSIEDQNEFKLLAIICYERSID